MESTKLTSELPLLLVIGDLDEASLAALGDIGFTVQVAAGGAEALAALLLGLRPSLLVLDMRVPERMDRLVLAALKTPELAEIPVVIVSEIEEPREDLGARLVVVRGIDAAEVKRFSRISRASGVFPSLFASGDLVS